MNKDKSFQQILVIRNPASTNASRLSGRINELKKLYPAVPFKIIETSPEGDTESQKIIVKCKKLLGPKTLFCIAAGDGTVNLVIETLLLDKGLDDNMRKTTVLPLWGGNANDLAHMLNGYFYFRKLAATLKQGSIIAVRPLRITLKAQNKKEIRIAACYASLGATAFAAHRINSPKHRKQILTNRSLLRLIPEIRTITKALRDVPEFHIKESGLTKRLYEYVFVNGSRIAKLERLPLRLTDNAFFVAHFSKKHTLVVLYFLQVLRKRRFGRITSNKRSFKLLNDTWLQLDGEVVRVKKHTLIEIELNPQPFYAVSSRLKQ